MNFNEKFKRFFTLSRSAEGFTLVELIVVIAILGLLAGITIPAYGQYVEKSQIAVDDQNIALMNNVFAVACVSNNVDPADVTAVEMNWTDDKTFEGLNTVTRTNTENPIVTAFNDYLGDPIVFNYYTEDYIFFRAGVFFAGKEMTYMLNGQPVTLIVSKAAADAMTNNTFSKEIGSAVLLGKVDTISNIAGKLIDVYDEAGNPSTFTEMIFDEDGTYLNNLAASLNMDPNSPEFFNFLMNDDGTWKKDVLANSLVLTAAQKSQGMDTSFLGTVGSADALRYQLDDPEKATDAMAKLALTYGMYTAYVNHEGLEDKSAEIISTGTFTGMTDVMKTIETQEFRDYLASEDGQADLDAYMASMQIINDSASSSTDATKDILEKGFDDTQLNTLLNGLMNPSAEE